MPADLPQARDAGTHREPCLSPGHAQLILAKWRRPGTDEAHLADQDVEQLRQLVEIQCTKNAAEGCHPGVVIQLEMRAVHLVQMFQISLSALCPHIHRAELPASKETPPQAFSLVPVEHGAFRSRSDRNRDEKQQWRQ